jgi:hypothetical protein
MNWTKKLDDMHIAAEGIERMGRTLCGKPMLGNNYASCFVEEGNVFTDPTGQLPDRKMCKTCSLRQIGKEDP